MLEDHQVQLNYVIPVSLEDLLTRYCRQNLVSPSALVRRLILEYVEGDKVIHPGEHPKGRRSTVALQGLLLLGFERSIKANGHTTKASVIAALLNDFLPHRVFSGDVVPVTIDLPVEVFNRLIERYGPGPVSAVILTALQESAAESALVKGA